MIYMLKKYRDLEVIINYFSKKKYPDSEFAQISLANY